MLQSPLTELSMNRKLRENGFTAEYRLNDEQKQLEALQKAKDLPGIVKFLTGSENLGVSNLELAVKRYRSQFAQLKVAILSPKIQVPGEDAYEEFVFTGNPQKGKFCVSALVLPPTNALFMREAYAEFLSPNVRFESVHTGAFTVHPLRNGYVFSPRITNCRVYFFLDRFLPNTNGGTETVFDDPGKQVKTALEKLKKDFEKLNELRNLGELSPEQFRQQANGYYEAFTASLKPLLE